MQGVKTIVSPCPCQTRKSRIHLRVCGARRDGRGRRDRGGAVGGRPRQLHPPGLAIFVVSRGLATAKMTGLPDGNDSRTRTMSGCLDPTALPLGGFLCAPFTSGTRAVFAPLPRPPPPPPNRGRRSEKGKSLWQPHLERDLNVKGSSTPVCRSKRQFPGSPETGR